MAILGLFDIRKPKLLMMFLTILRMVDISSTTRIFMFGSAGMVSTPFLMGAYLVVREAYLA